jgi:hypothetical protein
VTRPASWQTLLCGWIAVISTTMTGTSAFADFTNNILITGYWPPTNEMVRRFSTSTTQNPSGWIGGNWEGRGYNIHSFFPEFPGGTATNPKGNGDFEVDYQDTSEDWWRIANEIKPVAIITFSRGSSGANWEIEARTRNRTSWVNDYVAPFQPTPAPPDSSVPANTTRFSTLPMTQMRDNVNAASLGFSAFIDSTSSSLAGGFLSEFIGYHGMWYQSIHASPTDPYQTFAAGHIHVGIDTPLAGAMSATDISLRTLIAQLDAVVPEPKAGAIAMLVLGVVVQRRCARRSQAK